MSYFEKKNNNRNIYRASIGYTVGNYFIKGLSFLTIPIFTRILSPYDFGIYSEYTAYEGFLFLILGLGLHGGVKKAKYVFIDEFDEYNSSIILLALLNCVWFCGITAFFGNSICAHTSFDIYIIEILLLHSFGSFLLLYYNEYISLSFKYKKYILLAAINAISNIVISIVLIQRVFVSKRYIGRIVGSAIPVVTIGVFVIIVFFTKCKPVIRKRYWHYGLSYCLPIIPHGLSQLVLNQADRLMILKMIGAEEAGLYSFAYNIYAIVMVAVNSLSGVWTTWFYERINENDYSAIKIKANQYLLIISGIVSVVVLGAKELIIVFAHEAYWESIYCVIPITIAGFFWFVYSLYASVEYYYEKTRLIAGSSALVAVINVLLNALLIPRFGYIAAAYTTMVSYALYGLAHCITANIISKRHLFDERKIIICTAIVLFIGTFTIATLNFLLIRWLLLLLIVGFSVALTVRTLKLGNK